MNSIQINNDIYYRENYNPSKSVDLMKYVNNINRIKKNYIKENNLNIENDNEKLKNDNNNLLEDNEIIPERSLSNYINNQFLSGSILLKF